MTYDLICVGTGFASSFFLHQFLKTAKANAKVLVLERGNNLSLEWNHKNKKFSDIDSNSLFKNNTPEKPWVFTVRHGGGSNCWWACTPRMMPSDFEMKTKYGVAEDWPISYNEIEEYYCDAEEIMSISGTSNAAPYPRSRPYPQPPHRFNNLDLAFKEAYPDEFFIQATARARKSTAKRPGCCATGICHQCPVDAKFTIRRDMDYLFTDPRVEVKHGANVTSVDHINDIITGVNYEDNTGEHKVKADFVALGANAIFNPHILKRSGINTPALGEYLNEQVSVPVEIMLDHVDNFQGSTSITGQGYMFYDGEHRREYAAALLENYNIRINLLRMEAGRTRQIGHLVFVIEDIPQQNNTVTFDPSTPEIPIVNFNGHSEYAKRGLQAVTNHMQELSSRLPIESYTILPKRSDEAHLMGTHRMGVNPATSVVDQHQIHHKYRNLCILGSGSFVTCAPANPTLTIAALSLYSAKYLFN